MNNIKKLAILHPTFGYNGGAENVILAFSKYCHSLNIEITIYTYRLRDDVPNYIKQIKTDIKLNPFTFNKTAKFLINELINYDAVLIHNFPATIFFGLASKYAQRNNIKLPKSFWYCHEPSVRLYGHDDESYKKLQKTWDIIARYTMYLDRLGVGKIDYIMSNSIRTKEAVKRVYNREAEVIYPCITDTENIIPINEGKHFVYVGRIEKPKNLENAIIAFKSFIEKIEDKELKFIIAGKGRHENNLKKLTEKLNINNNIIFKGFVSDEEKKELLNKSYALVMPAINEPFGLTVIEALYSSCISIISNKSGVYEVVKDLSIGCNMENTDEIVNSMSLAYKDKNIKNEIINSSKTILDIFTVPSYSENVIKYIVNHL
ncbi:glycosyltransferase family 4 protein [Brachyspira hyodysenteriae]|uniref:Mannosyltransferase n=2 Tax=Brachyspira hyodysenteriae TaxID=159 RepID=A0A3B6VAE4_BRAHW|nr:glycosyltransferase family 4 protein [Brachyspira hyodysenteriae]ACN83047.1 mannosyltransferase [Brachyspira hyodysenteriae WA1]AUJ48792.1 mannosyltransferase [Brachyspira hyodysenteriae]KLI40724.1 mannosyltransferase [Brachyspira hyodysenteriae]KLI48058.1 mannosyltransferase [Brachyspira hyodysenteriae]KLI56178.1 mannosyltransferase [Brachyspira hyodysenteriae]